MRKRVLSQSNLLWGIVNLLLRYCSNCDLDLLDISGQQFQYFSLTDITHYWVFSCPSAYWYHINSEALPITYSVCWVSRISWQTLQPITFCYFVLGKRLNFTWIAAKGFECGTKGKVHRTQTPILTTWLSGPSSTFFIWTKKNTLFYKKKC